MRSKTSIAVTSGNVASSGAALLRGSAPVPFTAEANGVNLEKKLAVSVKDASALTGVGRTFLYDAFRTGELKSVKVGTRRLILIDELKKWLARHEVSHDPAKCGSASAFCLPLNRYANRHIFEPLGATSM